MLRKLVAAIIGASALVPGSVFGLGLGEVELESFLNQPLEARIELLQTRGLTPSEIIANLASSKEFAAAGVERSFFLSQLNFEVVKSEDGDTYLKVSSKRPVTEPYLNFLIEIQWPAGRLLREYTLLLDPPEFKDELPLAVRAPEVRSGSTGLSAARTAEESATGVQIATIPSEPAAPPPQSQQMPPEQVQRPEPVERSVAQQTPSRQRPSSQTLSRTETQPVPGSTIQTYTVKRGDTLANIVSSTQGDPDIPMPEALIAYQYLNPDAFIDNNINLVKTGAVLRVPSSDQIRNLSREEAVKEIAVQNRAWRAKVLARQQAQQKEELAGRQLDGTGRELAPDQAPATGDDGRLSIVVPSSEETSDTDGVSGQGDASVQGENAGIVQLENQLAMQREETEKFGVANESLVAELDELNAIIDKTNRVLTLKDEQIASLQAQLEMLREQEAAEAEAQVAGPQQPVAPAQALPKSPLDSGTPEENAEAIDDAVSEELPEDAMQEFDDAIAEPPSSTPFYANPLILGIAGGLVAAIAVLLWLRSRQQDDDEDEDEYEYTESLDTHGDESADLEANEGKFSEVFTAQALDRQLVEAEDEFDIDTLLSEADIYVAYGHFPKAISLLEKGLNDSPNSVGLNLKLMEVHAESKDLDAFQRVESHVRSFTSDDKVLGQINTMRRDLGLSPGTGPAASEESFSEEETQLLSDEPAKPLVSDEEDFLSLADIEAELDVGHGFNEELTTGPSSGQKPTGFTAEETQVNDSDEYDEELDLTGGELDFNFEETSVPEESTELDDLDSFSPDDALADIDQEIGSFDEDLTAAGIESELETPKVNELDFDESMTEEFGELDLDTLSPPGFENSEQAAAAKDLAEEVSQDEVAEDVVEAVDIAAEEELNLDSDFSLDDDSVELVKADYGDLSGEDASLLDGVDEVGTKLDLATAYIDMGDHEGAKDILDEVLLEGTEDQQQLARDLLEKVG